MNHQSKKPHAVCVPIPAQGHINPMMKLAKLLHHRGFHITFVNTEYNHNRLLKSRGPSALDGIPSFRFEAIPDGLPPSDNPDVTQDGTSMLDSMERTCLGPFMELVGSLDGPPVSCVIADAVLMFTVEAAEKLGVRMVQLWTASVCAFLGFVHCRDLLDRGVVPLKDESYLTNGYLDETVIDWIPTMEGINLKYLPTIMGRNTDPNDFMLNLVLKMIETNKRASAIIFNTFSSLDHKVFSAARTRHSPSPPPYIPIGPLHLLLEQYIKDQDDHVIDNTTSTTTLGSNLWKEDPTCLEWLDSRGQGSVVYVNFGSITVMTTDQLVEFAWGLANSQHYFLWIIRPDLGRGLLAPWCDQESVLRHPAVGGFLSHAGWNSMLESISCGIPMICWPFFADQQTNTWFSCEKWGIAMEIDSEVTRHKVEKQVRELMEGEKGKDMRKKATERKRLAHEAIAPPAGSSYSNFENLIQSLLLVP
ncbi:7-deoxyloganetin glucosyltransferase-like protein [Drosera capensis]